MAKLRGTFKHTDLSGKSFRIKPEYEERIPSKLERIDRVFDPSRDTQTHLPIHVGRIQAKDVFNSHANGKAAMNLWLVIKRPQSDVYHVPAELRQFSEFIQKVANFEHRRTPAAFTRAATLYVRQGTGTDSPWHYDTQKEDTTPSWHYVCCNMLPTQSTVLTFSEKDLNSVVFDGSFSALYDLTPFDQLAKKPKSSIIQGDPYDITRHSSSCLHKGTAANDSRERTFASISFVDFREAGEYEAYHPWRGTEGLKHTLSLPMEEASERLAHHLRAA